MVTTPILATISIISALEIVLSPLTIGKGTDRSVIQAEAVQTEAIQTETIQGADTSIGTIATLADGSYQVCSVPDPQDWQNGAGVCLVFNKQGDRVEGYYGYPHSDRFICLRGNVEANQITGEALTLSWAGNVWEGIPDTPFTWDDEGHLTLSQGNIVRSSGGADDRTDWILFRNAQLEVNHFYPYSPPRMVAPTQLCRWD
ncbi:MAG TPA: hypothetical protein V6C65_15450, partial [Allocoleopsis sp.]